MKQNRLWFLYAMITVVAWGVWGAYIDKARSRRSRLSRMTLVLCGLGIRHDSAGVVRPLDHRLETGVRYQIDLLRLRVGFLGAGGQLILFKTLRFGPRLFGFSVRCPFAGGDDRDGPRSSPKSEPR